MSEITNFSNSFLDSYISENRNKLDESLVSLRFMKEVDDFLELNKISQKDFANNVEYSEAFISQLMSGAKKFNASFINRLEKKYDLEVEFNIKSKKESNFISKISDSFIEININMLNSINDQDVWSSTNKPDEYYDLDISSYQLQG
ncbi:helix-turn-helix transcriptional regulator [Psychroflexus gondwanensis]|jgi:plasmid maintenance system antidote protein VapI|uniref:helix-turn-helix domain-containing protein n=1 Tax=Psychroflexus gondwanensis TaxID=251 RepID=UPI0011BF42FE|nr:helix-turn-helix transcriptional regulator [Psychroflexus gondwanensis]TXE16499.1 helix-turn-helix transcriptional regulator [Psychroflexus gondwanensis]